MTLSQSTTPCSLWRADATVHIEATSMEEAQGQMEQWVAEHMPSNFVIGWTLGEDPDA